MNRQIINRRYRVERKIGEGATAEVYLGFDIVLNRRVAIKVLRLHHAANRAFRLRFEREAQTATRFSHPNIIAVFDVGEDQGLPYIVMEFVEGQTLQEIIESEGPFHPDDVAVLVEQVAAGLDFAHKHGLVHRDVKPRNILVDRHGLAKLVDFGIAKGLTDSTLTESGTGLSTVQYISPEQASGLMATPESDIYSLGVVAFEMLTGQLPFESASSAGLAMAHLNDPAPDPSQINPNVPPEVADIVLQALEKNPTRRYPTAGAFARSLSDWRLYEPAPRLAAKLLSPSTAPIRAFEASDIENDSSGVATSGYPSSSHELPGDWEDENGRHGKSWIAGLIAVIAIGALFWYGFGLSDRFVTNEATPTAIGAANTRLAASPAATADSTSDSIAVPDVAGLTRLDAERQIVDSGLVVNIGAGVVSDVIPAGSVVNQNPPAASQAAPGDAVTIFLSTGPVSIDLAALEAEGRPSTVVVDELTSVGLNVVIVNEGSPAVPEGAVIRIEPSGVAKPGDQVSVFTSMGNRVKIPVDLQGQPLAIVRMRLKELGLTISAEIGVSAGVITTAGIDLTASGIDDGDVVGIQDNNAQFGGWIDYGASVTLVYYDAELAEPTTAPGT